MALVVKNLTDSTSVNCPFAVHSSPATALSYNTVTLLCPIFCSSPVVENYMQIKVELNNLCTKKSGEHRQEFYYISRRNSVSQTDGKVTKIQTNGTR